MARKGTDTVAVEVLYKNFYTTVQIERVLNVGSGQIVKVLKRLGIPSRKKNVEEVYTYYDAMTLEEKDALKSYADMLEGLFGNVEAYPIEERDAKDILTYLQEVVAKGVDGYAEEHMYTRLGGMSIHTLYKQGFTNKLIHELSGVDEANLVELMENYPTLWGNRRKAAILEGSGEVEGLEDLKEQLLGKVEVEVPFMEKEKEQQREEVLKLQEQGMNTVQIAAQLGVSRARISRLMNNKYGDKEKHQLMLAKDMICKQAAKFRKSMLGKSATTQELEEAFQRIYDRTKQYSLTSKQKKEIVDYIKGKLSK